MTSHLGLIPKCETDFVRLSVPGIPEEPLISRVRRLIDRETAPHACDYCIAWMGEPIPAGVQLPRRADRCKESAVGPGL